MAISGQYYFLVNIWALRILGAKEKRRCEQIVFSLESIDRKAMAKLRYRLWENINIATADTRCPWPLAYRFLYVKFIYK